MMLQFNIVNTEEARNTEMHAKAAKHRGFFVIITQAADWRALRTHLDTSPSLRDPVLETYMDEAHSQNTETPETSGPEPEATIPKGEPELTPATFPEGGFPAWGTVAGAYVS
jgi:hypothetical protein